jgi:hypothetical protein
VPNREMGRDRTCQPSLTTVELAVMEIVHAGVWMHEWDPTAKVGAIGAPMWVEWVHGATRKPSPGGWAAWAAVALAGHAGISCNPCLIWFADPPIGLMARQGLRSQM